MRNLSNLDLIAFILLIIGGINWGLIALSNYNFVEGIFGRGTTLTRIIYFLVGIAAIYTIYTITNQLSRYSSRVA